MDSTVYVDIRAPYLEEVAGKPYLINYTPLIFSKYDGMTGNAKEHISWSVDTLATHSHD